MSTQLLMRVVTKKFINNQLSQTQNMPLKFPEKNKSQLSC